MDAAHNDEDVEEDAGLGDGDGFEADFEKAPFPKLSALCTCLSNFLLLTQVFPLHKFCAYTVSRARFAFFSYISTYLSSLGKS